MAIELLKIFKRSLPWRVVVEPVAAEQARQKISAAFGPEEDAAKRRFQERLADFLTRLERNPLDVLGHPPLGTKDPNVFRYTADPQATISAIADLDIQARERWVTRINIKVGGHHGRRN